MTGRNICMLSLILLTACGGGGSDNDNATSPPPPLPSDPVTFILPDAPQQNQSIAVVAKLTNDTTVTSLLWQQVSGPEVFIAAPNSQVIAFDAIEAGEYVFEFILKGAGDDEYRDVITLSVQASNEIFANVRLDHSVTEQGNVSLRVDASYDSAIADVQWRQLQGPVVTLRQQQQYVFFDAPSVNSDTLIEVEATISYEDGNELKDTAWVLVANTQINDQDGYFPYYQEQVVSKDVSPYRNNGPYADVLTTCVYSNTLNQSCTFEALPLLGMEHPSPTLDQVLDRLVVSHPWMAERFIEFMQHSEVADDLLKLIAATTAVVISYDVRPSFYWSATGAIYIDPESLWVTPEERDSLNDAPDYRSDFGKELQFIMPWRYVKDNQYYLYNYPPELRQPRTLTAVTSELTWVLYHELAHANDFFPIRKWSTIGLQHSPLSYSNEVSADSQRLADLYPLQSQLLKGLAQVSFRGTAASSQQKALLADDIRQAFEPDNALMYYSYLTPQEDYALLFERFMMSSRLGVNADVAILASNNNPDLLVHWGQRGRIASDNIAPRVAFAVNNILPGLDVPAILGSLAPPQTMTPGLSWQQNLSLPAQAFEVLQHNAALKQPEIWQRHYHKQRERPVH